MQQKDLTLGDVFNHRLLLAKRDYDNLVEDTPSERKRWQVRALRKLRTMNLSMPFWVAFCALAEESEKVQLNDDNRGRQDAVTKSAAGNVTSEPAPPK
jgi:hypothetical protein